MKGVAAYTTTARHSSKFLNVVRNSYIVITNPKNEMVN